MDLLARHAPASRMRPHLVVTGSWERPVVRVQILGVGFVRPGEYAPWILSIGLPVGAILLLLKARKAAKAAGTTAL